MKAYKLIENDGVTWYMFGRDSERSDHVVDTNEYLIVSGKEGLLLDPGGTEIFPQVCAAVAQVLPIEKIKAFFCSHQDPDIMSSLPLWMGICEDSRVYLPRIWAGFISHFGHEYVKRFVKVEDGGLNFEFGAARKKFRLVPAHYCHSSGNFSLYDPQCKVLFSGDIGAALLPPRETGMMVENFDHHKTYMEGFHRRWMPSSEALARWCDRVQQLDIEYICPQHGAIFPRETIPSFLEWLRKLPVASAL